MSEMVSHCTALFSMKDMMLEGLFCQLMDCLSQVKLRQKKVGRMRTLDKSTLPQVVMMRILTIKMTLKNHKPRWRHTDS